MDTFVHSKLVLVDDVYMQMGSANHNNRGLLYEGEMATVVVNEDWVSKVRNDVMKALLGADFGANIPASEIRDTLETLANWNEYVRDNWIEADMDLNLNGEKPDASMIPEGFVYPLKFGQPDDCLVEGVGADIM